MAANQIIHVENLSVAFDNHQILADISFSTYKGEIAIILGTSGSGKTTILKHLLGLFPVQHGTVSVLGQNIAELTEEDQQQLYMKMGVFYQNGALLNSLSVAENVALPLEQHTNLPSDVIEQMVRTKLNLVGLNDAYDLYPSQLSGGMLKRAALTRAIIMDPVVLFCDEPGAGLDPVTLVSLDELIVNLKQQLGMSVVMVTHELASIQRIADRIVFIEKGRVAFEGSLSEAKKSTITPVKNFFGIG